MKSSDTILSELVEIAPVLATVSKKMPYQLPENYFFQSTENIQTAAFLSAADKHPYTVSAGYFEHLPKRILNSIYEADAATELNETAPLLASLKKENVYHVPEHYFNSLQSIEGVKVERKVKVVSLGIVRKLVSYAAAAVMAGVLITGAFLYSGHKNSFDLSSEINKVSDDELQNYLSSTSVHPATVISEENAQTINSTSTDLKEEIQFVSDEELQEYANEIGDISQKRTSNKNVGS